MAGNESFNEEHGIAEDYILDGYRIVEKLVNKNDFVLGNLKRFLDSKYLLIISSIHFQVFRPLDSRNLFGQHCTLQTKIMPELDF